MQKSDKKKSALRSTVEKFSDMVLSIDPNPIQSYVWSWQSSYPIPILFHFICPLPIYHVVWGKFFSEAFFEQFDIAAINDLMSP